MTRLEFHRILDQEFAQIRDLFDYKNLSYGADDDLFHNFRETAKRVFHKSSYQDMFKVLTTYVDKHWIALCNNGLDDPECLLRLRDIIVYALIGIAMYKETHLELQGDPSA